ncbi:MAG: tRNA(Ile)-lysidine synthetase [Proteobacteria bacterium]|nr:tRNA(Ile)-lysidine synthetase [Pseudomonadota bacterium]
MAGPKSRRCADFSAAGASHPLVAILSAFIEARLLPASRLCVGLSGGRDSVVLLHALHRLSSCVDHPFALSALHVHHGLSANADAWAAFCSELCTRCAVPLSIVRVTVAQGSGEGLESSARRARHAAFADCDADFLVLAHHRDDQAETVLLNLLRGAGIAGAAGMLAERAQGSGPVLVRPLLDVPRALIEDYAAAQSLAWIDDESNADTHFRRNYLRHEVMPRLAATFPGAPQSLARAASHFAEGAQLLDELAAIDRAALATAAGRIDLAGFNALSPARARNLLRFAWLAAGFRAPDTRWINEALRQLASADSLSETCVATVDGELHVYRGELHLVGHAPEVSNVVVSWSGEPELPWAGGRVVFVAARGSGIDRRLLQGGEVTLRPRLGGERLRPDAKRPRRSLRKLCQDAAIPPWERSRLPLLWVGGTLAWVGGLGVDAAFSCAPGDAGVLPVWALAQVVSQ